MFDPDFEVLATNRSFHTRLLLNDAQDAALRAAGEVYGKVIRTVPAWANPKTCRESNSLWNFSSSA